MGSSRWSGTAGHSQGHQWDRFWGHQSYFSCCTLWHPAWAGCRPHPSWIPTWSSALQPSCRATRSCAMRCPGARLRSTSTTFCHQWWLWDGSGSGQICPLQLCTDCIVLLELGTGEGGLLLTLSWRMVLVYWLFLPTRMSTSFWEEKKVCRQNVIGKQDERKVIFCLHKTHTNRNSNGIQSPIIYKINPFFSYFLQLGFYMFNIYKNEANIHSNKKVYDTYPVTPK